MNLAQKRILVTGGEGFLGNYVVEVLERRGCADIVTPAHKHFDFCKHEDVVSIMRFVNPDIVIHMAAVLGGIGAHENTQGQFLYDNLVMGLEVMEQARKQGVEKFVTIGTACSYPNETQLPVKESSLWSGFPNEITAPYGIAKLVLMLQGQYYRKQYGLNAISVIPANVYGPRDTFDPKKSHVIPALILKCLKAKTEGTPLVVWGTGKATREFIYATDCAEGIVRALEVYDGPEPLNLGTGVQTPISDVVRGIVDALGFQGEVKWDSERPDGHPGRVFDISAARRELGFEPRVGLREGLRKTIKWYLETQA